MNLSSLITLTTIVFSVLKITSGLKSSPETDPGAGLPVEAYNLNFPGWKKVIQIPCSINNICHERKM